MIDFMQSYASYFRGQTQEWFAKSVKSLAGVGSDRSDPQHATFLLDQTQPVLVAALSKYLHNPPAHVHKFIDSPGYCRSCRTFRDDGLWGQLGYHWGPLHSKNLRCTSLRKRSSCASKYATFSHVARAHLIAIKGSADAWCSFELSLPKPERSKILAVEVVSSLTGQCLSSFHLGAARI